MRKRALGRYGLVVAIVLIVGAPAALVGSRLLPRVGLRRTLLGVYGTAGTAHCSRLACSVQLASDRHVAGSVPLFLVATTIAAPLAACVDARLHACILCSCMRVYTPASVCVNECLSPHAS